MATNIYISDSVCHRGIDVALGVPYIRAFPGGLFFVRSNSAPFRGDLLAESRSVICFSLAVDLGADSAPSW